MGLVSGEQMSTITSVPQSREGVGSVRLPNATPSAKPTARPAVTTGPDQVQLNNPVNPYEGFASETARVSVDRWKKGPNDSIEHILRNQGYSAQDIYRRDASGKTLIQRVADANGLKDPNLIRPGKKGLLVPVKGEKPEVAKPEAAKPEAAKPEATQPEAAKPEATQPEAAKPEATQPEAAQPEAAQPEAAQPEAVKPEAESQEAEKPKKGRRRFWIFGPRIEEKPEPVKAEPAVVQAPAAETPPVEAQQAQAAVDPQLAEAESAEVGLLLQGVKDQKFTRNEFQALNSTANQYTELRAQYARDGFKPEQVRELSQVQQQYGQMYARFLADDKAKVTFSGAQSADPTARFRAQQNEEGGQVYDQFVAQQLDEATVKARLLAQRHQASNLGVKPE
jgi:hypothetical protein